MWQVPPELAGQCILFSDAKRAEAIPSWPREEKLNQAEDWLRRRGESA